MTQDGYPLELELLIGLFVFIVSLICVQQSYFAKRWMPFCALLVCVIVSGAFLVMMLCQWLIPPPQQERTPAILQPTTPL